MMSQKQPQCQINSGNSKSNKYNKRIGSLKTFFKNLLFFKNLSKLLFEIFQIKTINEPSYYEMLL